MISILTNLYDEKLRSFRLTQLLENKSKSAEEIAEQNDLVEQKFQAEEMRKDPEYTDMIRDFAKGYFHSEDIDFVIGTIYGMAAQGISKRDMEPERKEKMLRMCANMWFHIRNEAIAEMRKNMSRPMEQPQPGNQTNNKQ